MTGVSNEDERIQLRADLDLDWKVRFAYLMITSFTACSLNNSLMRLRIFSFW